MTRGPLTAEQQLRVLGKIWGNDRDGFVFLPWIEGSANTVARRRRGYHEGRAYEWPKERQAILEHLTDHTSDDLYFTPALFNAKRRTEQNVDAERVLWADLDPVDPHTLGDLRPTIAWESSPGRYQAVWLLDTPRMGASWPSKENHRLSLHIGADPSGWDSTQLLRVPGRTNHKFVYGNAGVPGKLLWDNGPRFVWPDFDHLPEVGVVAGEDIDLLDDELIASVDRHKLWATVRLKVPHRIRELMALRTAPSESDRSEVLWDIERSLADAGCTLIQIIALVRPSVWNKYAGRNDELRRLKTEAAKAIAARGQELESEAEEPKPTLRWLRDIALDPVPRPAWIIEDIWSLGACGFIAGAPKSYKSWLALDLAVSIATGQPFLGQTEYRVRRPGSVLYIQEEDDVRLVMSRLSSVAEARAPDDYWKGSMALYAPEGGALGVRQGRRVKGAHRVTWSPPARDVPIAVHVQTGFIASDPAWQAWLADAVAEGSFRLVVIDTLGTTAGEVDTDRASELMPRLLRPLRAISQAAGCGIAIVHHNRKNPTQGSSKPGAELLGSVALHAWVDCALYARAEKGELTIHREAKLAPELTMRVRVPHMREHLSSGERQLWEPQPILEGAAEGETPEAKPKASTRRRGMGEASLRLRMKHAGGGPLTAERLAALGITEATLKWAEGEGIVKREGDAWRLID